MVKVTLFKGSSYGKSYTMQRQFLWRKLHYSKAVLTVKVTLFKGSSYGESYTISYGESTPFKGCFYGKTHTIQRQFLRQKLHYSKAVLMAKVILFKGSSYGESYTIQRQFLRLKLHYSKGVLTVKQTTKCDHSFPVILVHIRKLRKKEHLKRDGCGSRNYPPRHSFEKAPQILASRE